MSFTTIGGPVILLAEHSEPVIPENDEHVHNAQHAPVSHSHVATDDLGLKNLHVKPDGLFDSVIKATHPGIGRRT